jgi:hypothetical protein
MKVTKFIAMIKQFCGPLICVTFAWLAVRWTVGLIAFAKLWPWLDCSWGGCSLPPPPQTYFLAVVFAIIGACVYVMVGSFIYMGWRWFRIPQSA